MNPKKFRKGKHTYIEWGKGVKEVKKVNESIQRKELKIKLDDQIATGHYANMAFIAHTAEEFVIDFILQSPGQNQAKVVSRIITSPGHAKRLQMALNENIVRYEKRYGKIAPTKQPDSKVGFN